MKFEQWCSAQPTRVEHLHGWIKLWPEVAPANNTKQYEASLIVLAQDLSISVATISRLVTPKVYARSYGTPPSGNF